MELFREFSKESKMIFRLIQQHKSITKKELCTLTNNNITTLNRFFQPLESSGLIVESGSGDSVGGRKPVLYSINPRQHYVGAVNISSTYYEVAITNFKLQVVSMEHYPITKRDMPDQIISKIATEFHNQCAMLGISREQIHGVGVSVFSSFDRATGKINRPINLYLNEQWIGYSLEEKIKKQLELPVVIENITAAVSMLEYYYGSGKETSKLMYVLCAMNIRSMMIHQGDLLSDSMFYEDAFGHTTVDFDGVKCVCGNYGCVNCYATIPAIVDSVNKSVKAGIQTVLKDKAEITIQDIYRAAEEGDPTCLQAIIFAATMLGIGLANYINLVRPDLVIISGLLASESNLYYETCIRVAQERLTHFVGREQVVFMRNGQYSKPFVVSAGAIMIEELLRDPLTEQ